VPEPKPKSTDLLIKIKAIALNRADLGSAKGDTSQRRDGQADRQRVLGR
jgi:NADPH:quinone reductase-like Zn-dependent oxidoreductase